jgi:hypothetical protein
MQQRLEPSEVRVAPSLLNLSWCVTCRRLLSPNCRNEIVDRSLNVGSANCGVAWNFFKIFPALLCQLIATPKPCHLQRPRSHKFSYLQPAYSICLQLGMADAVAGTTFHQRPSSVQIFQSISERLVSSNLSYRYKDMLALRPEGELGLD